MDTVVASIVCSAAEATYADAGPDSTLQPNETQQEHGCQYQSMYSNNTDNQDNHMLGHHWAILGYLELILTSSCQLIGDLRIVRTQCVNYNINNR
jgi:hypothetical protein